MAIHEFGVRELADRIRAKELSAGEAVAAIFDRIDKTEPIIQAFLHLDPEYARRRAKVIDQLSAEELQHLPLAGVPIAVKDNMTTISMPTTAGSKILKGFMSPYNATVVDRLEAAGAIIVGKTNLDEFAMGSSTEHSAYHITRNPWDTNRVPGGSSGGSAAAVAARMVPAALGSDTGGSIRQPASYCGVTGLKPTYGRVSRYGLIAFASSLDQIGPLTRNAEDARLLYEVIAGHDPLDATSLPQTVESGRPSLPDWRDVRIGVPKEYDGEGIAPRVQARYHEVLALLQEQGAQLVELSLPHTRYAIATYYLVAPAEASSNLSRFDGVRYGFRAESNELLPMYERTRAEGFGSEVTRRILLGTHALSAGYYDAYYLKAQKVRTLIRRDFELAFGQVDVILAPTTPDIAFQFGEKSQDPLQMYLSDVYTVTANLAGIPGISTPAGLIGGVPVGIQWLGAALQETRLLEIAQAFEHLWPAQPWPSVGGDL